MRKIIISLMFVILLASLASAEIIITQEPSGIYNLGDYISIPTKIKSSTDITGSFEMDLICSGHQVNFYKNPIKLSGGEEKEMDSSLLLTKDMVGEIIGNCIIKARLNDDYVLTGEFTVSDLIKITLKTEETEVAPGGYILIKGDAIKENKVESNGIIELQIIYNNASASITQVDTIKNGFFSINLSIPNDLKAGTYTATINAFEKDFSQTITNKGSASQEITVKQFPTSLEIFFENQEIEPGTNLKVKAILHDQTGEPINSTATIKIKDENNALKEQVEKQTGEFLEFPIAHNEPPAEWTVTADSNLITADSTFTIKEKQEIKLEIINKSLTITNVGNVYYNKSVLIKIGNESLNINVSLAVDEEQKYILKAPDGEYEIEVITDEGIQLTQSGVMLTGSAIGIKEASEGLIKLVRHPLVWIFIIAIMGFVAFIVFKKGYQKTIYGYVSSKISKKKDITNPIEFKKKATLINTNNKAELSLSIKGDKQDASIICLKIKNLKEIQSKKGNVEETLQKINSEIEDKKAAIYENQENIFIIFAPVKTKTFKNQRTALDLAQEIKKELDSHNKLFKQKINYGISLNHGTIIARQTEDVLKFMSMGTLITTAKKLASLSDKEIYLSETINDKLRTDIRTTKEMKDKLPIFKIKEVKKKGGDKTFITGFLKRLESGK